MFVSADRLPSPATDDDTSPGAEALLLRVIGQAVEDSLQTSHRADAHSFLSGPTFRRYCALLGWDPDWAQQRITRYLSEVA